MGDFTVTATRAEVLEWLDEGFKNCLRLAASKSGADQGGWYLDAAYYSAAIALIKRSEASQQDAESYRELVRADFSASAINRAIDAESVRIDDRIDRANQRRPDGDRSTDEPGGMECENCGCIFIGAEWHSLCAVCALTKA